jgi:DNA-binding HxlR family transcriptional regulator
MQICITRLVYTISQKNMTSSDSKETTETCPAQGLLKALTGKWKPEIFRLAVEGPLRFSTLLRDMKGSNKQSLTIALREMEEADLLSRVVIKPKPLHVEYNLTEKGKSLIPVFLQLEGLV